MPLFDNRDLNVGIIKVSELDSKSPFAEFSVADARTVILHCAGKSVLLRKIRSTGRGVFTGAVLGFEPADEQVPGLSQGDYVDFEGRHVISIGE